MYRIEHWWGLGVPKDEHGNAGWSARGLGESEDIPNLRTARKMLTAIRRDLEWSGHYRIVRERDRAVIETRTFGPVVEP